MKFITIFTFIRNNKILAEFYSEIIKGEDWKYKFSWRRAEKKALFQRLLKAMQLAVAGETVTVMKAVVQKIGNLCICIDWRIRLYREHTESTLSESDKSNKLRMLPCDYA
ncbi:hypothetical protein [Erwinia mallotivora]|uniref:Uncharacterized protein n=1 Tax=Erwinia mallotivora TaxID=69222 RepID=A0A014NRV3_9GAMM|nr:hypothetical protein [Erwinia mallotivora]EXU76595.1 hypothetical protein BG55_04695 [Erwinia mallotivora]